MADGYINKCNCGALIDASDNGCCIDCWHGPRTIPMTTPLTTALTALMEKVKLPGIKRITDSDMPAIHVDHEGIYGGTVVSTLRFDVAEQIIIGCIVQACVERGWTVNVHPGHAYYQTETSMNVVVPSADHKSRLYSAPGTDALAFVTAFAAAVGRESDGD